MIADFDDVMITTGGSLITGASRLLKGRATAPPTQEKNRRTGFRFFSPASGVGTGVGEAADGGEGIETLVK